MRKTVEILDLAVAINAKTLNPSILNQDFLKHSGIVPNDWETAGRPLCSNQVSQIAFQNGISIIAQPRTITFVEPIGSKPFDQVKVADLARQYIDRLPNAEYESVGINPRGHVAFNELDGEARQYLFQQLLASGPWLKVGKVPVQASVNFVYGLDGGQLRLTVTEAALRSQDSEPVPGILFVANFNRELTEEVGAERLQRLRQALANWQTNLEGYKELIDKKFLAPYADATPPTVARE